MNNNLNHVLIEVGLLVQPDGELQKFENNVHNAGMTPMFALMCYLAKSYEQEIIVSRMTEMKKRYES